jgi:hypothetical protein
VYRDPKIARPYLTEVRALDGTQITRNHPPREGVDATDHDTMHPGIWIAFGDIDGADFWRNKASVEHEKFEGAIVEEPGLGAFTALNAYRNNGADICQELRTTSFITRPDGYYVLIVSEFSGKRPFSFGDQEEMGLGVRVATPLAVVNGGHIANSAGQKDEAECWGKTALWAQYGGMIDGKPVGVVVMPDPKNFRPSWFHARDYGFIAANPFGRKAFTGGEPSRVEVAPKTRFRLAYGVYVYSGQGAAEPDAAYTIFLEMNRDVAKGTADGK